jgi:hypothetical protein
MMLAALILTLLLSACTEPPLPPSTEARSTRIEGVVLEHGAPVEGAVVRVRGTEHAVVTGADGMFVLRGLKPRTTVTITAWAEGFFIGNGGVRAPGDFVSVELERHPTGEDPSYAFLSAYSESGEGFACELCHSDAEDPWSNLPFDEWVTDAHANTATNVRFLTMYQGTDVFGNSSPPTRYVDTREYGPIPLGPDPDEPWYGPGYTLDFPDTSGSCGACHLPLAALDDPFGVDPTHVSGPAAEGINCDYCHKVSGVVLDPATGVPFPGMPGVLSTELVLPPPGVQYTAGPFDDVPGDDIYDPLYNSSDYCAPCHHGEFWGVVVYDSYGEWLDSPFSDPADQTTCQDCHMPTGLTDRFASAAAGGIHRDPERIFSHRMPGALDQAFLAEAVRLDLAASSGSYGLRVTATVENTNAGHGYPTGSPLRHLLLVLRATDDKGRTLAQLSGPAVPSWGGEGDPNEGYYAGLPGRGFAKVLEQAWTGAWPTGAYWTMTTVRSDNRLAPFEPDVSRYVFERPVGGAAVEATLIYRRAYRELDDWKGWDDPDIVLARQTVLVEER